MTNFATVGAQGLAVLCGRPTCLGFALAILALTATLATTFAAALAAAFAASALALSPRFSSGTERHQKLRVVFGTQLRDLVLPFPAVGHRPLHELVGDRVGFGQEEFLRPALHNNAPRHLESPVLGRLIVLEILRDHVVQ